LPKSRGVDTERKTDEPNNNDSNDTAHCVNIPIGSRKRKRSRRRLFQDDSDLEHTPHQITNTFTRRRHAADETAFLLAKAISAGVRTIAFCKTRSLVEWVYERTLAILQSNQSTCALTSKVESYRGGYTAEARRSIEERLFHRKLLGVVGTCALELGVDVGGVDLTLHTGYPGSISSLLQQSGRAGRGKEHHNVPSCAIMVCFSSPSEQHIWKNPNTLLSRGLDAPPNLPINDSVMQGHLLCAGDEFPLTGGRSVSCLLNEFTIQGRCPSDCDLFGPSSVYFENVDFLAKKGLLSQRHVSVFSDQHRSGKSDGKGRIPVYLTHPVSARFDVALILKLCRVHLILLFIVNGHRLSRTLGKGFLYALLSQYHIQLST
jgi:DEAD/DEAH box helicase domain-containing protein